MKRGASVAWVTSWDRVCGIADYSKRLWPEIGATLQETGGALELISLDEFKTSEDVAGAVKKLNPALVHFQHEYGLYGGKNPPAYWFPDVVRRVSRLPNAPKQIATAHTVLDPQYRFPVKGRGLQAPLRLAANTLLLPWLRGLWAEKTWSPLDGVIVHSRLQREWIEASGQRHTAAIPHFVPALSRQLSPSQSHPALEGKTGYLLVFGFFTPEKGQDVVIEALRHLPKSTEVVFAGGVRRGVDASYFERCKARVQEFGLSERVTFTGFVSPEQMDTLYRDAALVIAPFRETSGSGSLAQAFARGAPILASDLRLNLEMSDRVPGSVATFRSEDPLDCAAQVSRLLQSLDALRKLREASIAYAGAHSPSQIARSHVEFYREIIAR
jgi:glycosyltransferase involved in cell wall biosynthesis